MKIKCCYDGGVQGGKNNDDCAVLSHRALNTSENVSEDLGIRD